VQVVVLAKIGEGAFGEVSLAQCATYGRVAVKWIKPTKVGGAGLGWDAPAVLSGLAYNGLCCCTSAACGYSL